MLNLIKFIRIFIRDTIILVFLVLFFPIMVLCMVIIFLDDGSPVFFYQTRLGMNKKPFKLLKLRTMKKNTIWVETQKIDKGFILKSGHFIRKFKLDEFPQLFNVLKRDISLIGPRPCLENQSELIAERIRLSAFDIEQGLTGLSQVCGIDMSNPKKVAEIDAYYLKNKSIMLDLTIMVSTFTGLFKKFLLKKISNA